jgi:protection-of-telomeres protein 1
VVVSSCNADYLFSLHHNPHVLFGLKEKLFILWGNLQELKEAGRFDGEARESLRSKPFECCIEEYGAEQDGKWVRMWRMFKTKIA